MGGGGGVLNSTNITKIQGNSVFRQVVPSFQQQIIPPRHLIFYRFADD